MNIGEHGAGLGTDAVASVDGFVGHRGEEREGWRGPRPRGSGVGLVGVGVDARPTRPTGRWIDRGRGSRLPGGRRRPEPGATGRERRMPSGAGLFSAATAARAAVVGSGGESGAGRSAGPGRVSGGGGRAAGWTIPGGLFGGPLEGNDSGDSLPGPEHVNRSSRVTTSPGWRASIAEVHPDRAITRKSACPGRSTGCRRRRTDRGAIVRCRTPAAVAAASL